MTQNLPGIFMLRPNWKITQVVDYLVLAAHTGDPALAQDWVEFIP